MTFVLLLPHLTGVPLEEGRAPVAMIVEDEAIIAMGLEDGLADHGYEMAGPFSACADALAYVSAR